MTPYKIMMRYCGLSLAEAAALHGVPRAQIENWSSGKSRTPPGVMDEIKNLALVLTGKADEHIADVANDIDPHVDLYYPESEAEAVDLGYPTVSAWMAMAGQVISVCEVTLHPAKEAEQ